MKHMHSDASGDPTRLLSTLPPEDQVSKRLVGGLLESPCSPLRFLPSPIAVCKPHSPSTTRSGIQSLGNGQHCPLQADDDTAALSSSSGTPSNISSELAHDKNFNFSERGESTVMVGMEASLARIVSNAHDTSNVGSGRRRNGHLFLREAKQDDDRSGGTAREKPADKMGNFKGILLALSGVGDSVGSELSNSEQSSPGTGTSSPTRTYPRTEADSDEVPISRSNDGADVKPLGFTPVPPKSARPQRRSPRPIKCWEKDQSHLRGAEAECLNWADVEAVCAEKEFDKALLMSIEIVTLPQSTLLTGDENIGEKIIFALQFSDAKRPFIPGDDTVRLLLPEDIQSRFIFSSPFGEIPSIEGDTSNATNFCLFEEQYVPAECL